MMEKTKGFVFAKTALKNLFTKPATVGYPFEPAHYPERMRGHVEIRIEECIGCSLCAKNCPPGAITVDRAAGSWSIERFDCVQCGNCVNVCPKKCLELVSGYTEPGAEKKTELFVKSGEGAAGNFGKGAAGGGVGAEGAGNCGKGADGSQASVPAAGGKPVNDTEKCVFCTLCAKKCPQEAITVDRAEKSWVLDEESCVGCGICAEACPKKCLEMK